MEHLENIRYGDTPYCPHCGSTHVARKADSDRIGRWNCHDCKSSFNVLSGTIFEKTQVPLQKWFMAVGLMMNARKSLSSCQLARDLELNQKTAWFMQHRIRAEMAVKQSEISKCALCPQARVIHISCASRYGIYDFGVNRARVERLRRKLQDR